MGKGTYLGGHTIITPKVTKKKLVKKGKTFSETSLKVTVSKCFQRLERFHKLHIAQIRDNLIKIDEFVSSMEYVANNKVSKRNIDLIRNQVHMLDEIINKVDDKISCEYARKILSTFEQKFTSYQNTLKLMKR
ncbi:hypothetical protein N8901_00165 [Gammaproteobacteria bacterium]|nr:hypothetical protein [Gammaproteobacteria bacterium]